MTKITFEFAPGTSEFAPASITQICTIDEDGTNLQYLTYGNQHDVAAVWSPDRSKIAFLSNRDWRPLGQEVKDEIYVMDADGSNETRITDDGTEKWHPSWSPDGRKIVYGTDQIYVINADGSGQPSQLTSTGFNSDPAWSPDGRKIAFRSYRDGIEEIYVMNANGTNQTRLTFGGTQAFRRFPTWSPDGSKIAYQYGGSIYVMNADGSNPVSITGGQAPSWSPDGLYITYYASTTGGRYQILRINADGSGTPLNLTYSILGTTGNSRSPNYPINPFPLPPNHEGAGFCPFCYTGDDQIQTLAPVSLLKGEKREEVTDLSINTPAGSLAFTRAYRQSKQGDMNYRFMGLGWTHNHAITLFEQNSTTIHVRLPNGSEMVLRNTTGQPNHYQADPGANSTLEVDPSADYDPITEVARYTLTAADQSLYFFDSMARLCRRRWSNGEYWEYLYDANNNLEQVIDDGYALDGASPATRRKLIFTYYADTGQQLKRVTDHTGRYVEFGYTLNKVDNGGSVEPGNDYLLTSVTDVRNSSDQWFYDYYGQDTQETDLTKLNLLTRYRSPLVDMTGDGVGDAQITLKALTYTLSQGIVTSLTQEQGIIGTSPAVSKTDYVFDADGENKTLEKIAGLSSLTTTHIFANDVYIGSSDPLNQQKSQGLDISYRPAEQIDANGNATTLEWNADGKQLRQVIDALSHATQFEYNAGTDTLDYSIDTEGRRTQYTYGDPNNPRQPTRVQVIDADGTTILRWQEFTYDSKGRVLTEKLVNPANPTGTALQETSRVYHASGFGNGLLHTVTQNFIGSGDSTTTTYLYDALGRVVQTNQGSTFGSCDASYTVFDAAGNVVASLCNFKPGTTNPMYPTTVQEAKTLRQRLYNTGDPDHYTDPTTNRLTIHEYDSLGRRIKTIVSAEDPYQQISLTFYDAVGRVRRTISNYINQSGGSAEEPGKWVWSTSNQRWEKSASDTTPISHGSDNSQNIISDSEYNERGLVKCQRDVLGNVALYGYDPAGRLVKTVQNASNPSYNNGYTGTSPDPTLGSYPAPGNGNPAQDIITSQGYDAVGNVVKSTNALGQVTLTGYDPLNRPVRVIRSASDPGYDLTADPTLASYTLSTLPDKDLVEETEYDALGRVLQMRRLLDNRGSAQWQVSRNVYDGLGRQVRSIGNYIDQGEDPSLWVWDAAQERWEKSTGTAIDHGTDNDQNLVMETVYDAAGRVQYSRDMEGSRTWYTYDGLGRQQKTIANCSYDGTGTAPEGSSYVGDLADPAEDIIAETVYDGKGRVQKTKAVLRTNSAGTDLEWRWTLYGYDSIGRRVKTIQNASNPSYDMSEATGDPDLSDYIPVSDSDKDIITSTEYDAMGRVFKTTDTHVNETVVLYDSLGRRIKTVTNYVAQGTVANWLWSSSNSRWEDGSGSPISFGTDNDQNRISTASYDIAGRVRSTRDAAGIETLYIYDTLGRRLKTVTNYVVQGSSNPANWVWSEANQRWEDGSGTAIDQGSSHDQNLLSTTTYNRGGQVISTRDTRGTQTAFSYDSSGRRLTVTQALDTPWEVTGYTCYDKAGRVLRSIQNWIDNGTLPDAKTGVNWDFNPQDHGANNDRNLITTYDYDLAGRQIKMTDPLGNFSTTRYFSTGQVKSMTDAEGMVTQYRYDGLHRRIRVVQGFVDNGEDPQQWVYNNGWKKSDGTTAIANGTHNDQNIMADVSYDKAGRTLTLRNPAGYVTTYEYDLLDRRTQLTNPLDIDWLTAYANVSGGKTSTTVTYPGINAIPGTAASYSVQRDFDRLGRLSSIQYLDETPKETPDVRFSYDNAGNRAKMSEYSDANFTNRIRETTFSYDDSHRLSSVGFDNTGDGVVDETVSYEYDAGGLRTRLVMPGSLNITYVYDSRGRLVGMTDWDGNHSQFGYDTLGRHIATSRSGGLNTHYTYDPASHLRDLHHSERNRTLARFNYQTDKRGNRTQTYENVARPSTISETIGKDNVAVNYYQGTWGDDGDFKRSTQFSARAKVTFTGTEVWLTMGTGSDASIFDIYIDGSLWESFDGYAASGGTLFIPITLTRGGTHVLDIRNRPEQHPNSTGYALRFEKLEVVNTAYDAQTIVYTYDALSRLLDATYYAGTTLSGTPLRQHTYTFDTAGNRRTQVRQINGVVDASITYTYNPANQLTGDGTNDLTYDPNGNLINDSNLNYTRDRANRLLALTNATTNYTYAYDGLNNRRYQQNASAPIGVSPEPVTWRYLLDLQPGLPMVIAEQINAQSGTHTMRYLHSPRGVHAQKDTTNQWEWLLQDGLGSVRGTVSSDSLTLESHQYEPYGVPFGQTGIPQTPFAFTGEMRDTNGLQYHRARYLNPSLGVWLNLDPFEGVAQRLMSLNGYSWVEGNVINAFDSSGFWGELPNDFAQCAGVLRNGLKECFDRCSVLKLTEANLCMETCVRLGENDRCSLLREYARSMRTTVDSRGTLKQNLSIRGTADLDALIDLIEFSASIGTSSRVIADDISCALLGARGPNTVFDALFPAITNREEGTAWDWFKDTGFHLSYRDAGNQVNHFWTYVNSAAQGGTNLARIGNTVHEHLAIPEIFAGARGASIQDERLSYLGLALGLAIYEGYIQPEEMGSVFRRFLSSPYPVEDPSNPNEWTIARFCMQTHYLAQASLGPQPGAIEVPGITDRGEISSERPTRCEYDASKWPELDAIFGQ